MESLNIERYFDEPRLMAILNVTPDSFYNASRKFDAEAVAERVREIVEQGADIIDIGGYSSRPGADDVSTEEETRRVMLGAETAREIAPDIVISIDTFRSEVARAVLNEYGSNVIINDISASELDPSMVEVVARFDAAYIAMHMRGTPDTMQQMTKYDDVVGEVRSYLETRAEWLKSRGVRNIILDPGFGFAKTTEQNYRLLDGFNSIAELGYPVLSGLSRKSLIYYPLGITPADALPATLTLHWESLTKGASIIRAHDVKETKQIINIYKLYKKYGTTGYQYNRGVRSA